VLGRPGHARRASALAVLPVVPNDHRSFASLSDSGASGSRPSSSSPLHSGRARLPLPRAQAPAARPWRSHISPICGNGGHGDRSRGRRRPSPRRCSSPRATSRGPPTSFGVRRSGGEDQFQHDQLRFSALV
jgi:hypothetical protein